MSHNEDCSAVLEQFIHDVANLPAEINHLMEEIQVKDTTMAECRSIINSRDNSIQRFIKMNGSLTPNPKEEAYTKAIAENLDKSIALQDEKIALAERASTLLDRQVKRLDVRLRDLVKEGLLANDPPLPSLLVPKQNQQQGPQQQQQQAASQQQPNLPAGGANASLKYLSGHVPSGLANSTSAQGGNGRNSSFSSLSGAQATPRSSLNQQARPFSPGATAAGAPGSAAAMHLQRQREASMSGSDAKRRRISSVLGASTGISGVGSTPAAPSGLRQSSAGPGAGAGTASTGGATGARAGAGAAAAGRSGSAGPKSGTALKKTGAGATKKVAPHQQVKKIKIASGGSTKTKGVGAGRGLKVPGSSVSSPAVMRKKSPAAAMATLPSDEEDSVLSSPDASDLETLNNAGMTASSPALDDDGDIVDVESGAVVQGGDVVEGDGDGEDTKVYCTCRTVSHGDMVACDNEECPYEWFHWKCVGLTREPPGTWYCEECKTKLGK